MGQSLGSQGTLRLCVTGVPECLVSPSSRHLAFGQPLLACPVHVSNLRHWAGANPAVLAIPSSFAVWVPEMGLDWDVGIPEAQT